MVSGPKPVLAIEKVQLGDTDVTGAPNPQAWKDYGVDLGGLVTSATDTQHCK